MNYENELVRNQILEWIGKQRTYGSLFLAIDGRCAAGKTTLASDLQNYLDCDVFHMDDFFLQPAMRTAQRLEEPGGNVDYERFLLEVLKPLKQQQQQQKQLQDQKSSIDISYRPYSCRTQLLLAPVRVYSHPFYIIEGSYACHPALWDYYDLHIFLSCSSTEQLHRIKLRNGEQQLEQFQNKWIPLEERYFKTFSIEEQCDLTFKTDEYR